MRIIFERRIILTPQQMANRTVRPKPDLPRSPGVHVQAINKALGVAAGKLSDADGDDYPFERFSDSVYPLMPALGVAWEELRASTYPEDELIWQPGELERDGIYGTHDGLWLGQDGAAVVTAIWECKQTTKKFQSIGDLWMYTKQGLSYCAMSGLSHVLYDICFLLGDYTRPYQPIGITTLVEFTEKEQESWWGVILKNKNAAKAEGRTDG